MQERLALLLTAAMLVGLAVPTHADDRQDDGASTRPHARPGSARDHLGCGGASGRGDAGRNEKGAER